MISDVDDTLRTLLTLKMPLEPGVVDITFDMPTRDRSHELSRPTINLHLYDVRENTGLRSTDRYLTRSGCSGVQQHAPVQIDLAYFITAWAPDVAAEHQFLGQLLTTVLRYTTLPTDVVKGSLRRSRQPLSAGIARPEGTPNPWDVWRPVENRMKAALSYVVTASFDAFG